MQLARLSFPVSRRRAAETTAALRQGAASGEEMVSGGYAAERASSLCAVHTCMCWPLAGPHAAGRARHTTCFPDTPPTLLLPHLPHRWTAAPCACPARLRRFRR